MPRENKVRSAGFEPATSAMPLHIYTPEGFGALFPFIDLFFMLIHTGGRPLAMSNNLKNIEIGGRQLQYVEQEEDGHPVSVELTGV
jgi:hypothetical protein